MAPALKDFEGKWLLDRKIEDRRAGVEGHLTGEVEFLQDPDAPECLLYLESGELAYGNQAPVLATRRYRWCADGEHIRVFFDDGRPFHKFALDKSMPDANHHCEPDLYHVNYNFSRWPKWKALWRVIGPSKDYRMISAYRRP